MILSEGYVERAAEQALQMQRDGAQTQKILTHLANTAETISGDGAVSSILVLDKNGLLRNGASPQLPGDYLKAIDGIRPNARVGTCAAAAATGAMVVTLDFRADDKWAELRHLPIALGFVGAWSLPIKNPDGKVLGTFGIYYRTKRAPTEREVSEIAQLVIVAATVLN